MTHSTGRRSRLAAGLLAAAVGMGALAACENGAKPEKPPIWVWPGIEMDEREDHMEEHWRRYRGAKIDP